MLGIAAGFLRLRRLPPWPVAVAAIVFALAWLTRRPDEAAPLVPAAAGEAREPASRFDAPSAAWVTVPPERVPVLRMPFPAGTVVLCAQGNHSGEGRTHGLPQNLHALDFSSRVAQTVEVVAAAAGTVAYVFRDAAGAPHAGGGYGNQVRVLHAHGLYTLYAHLDRVDVKPGDRVTTGQRLGTMGRTGLAGDRHLHFSLHYGIITGDGVPATVPIPALLTRDMSTMTGFELLSGGELVCSRTGHPWSGSLYASENDGGRQQRGDPGPELSARLLAAGDALERATARRQRLWQFSTEVPRTTPLAARRFLAPLLEEAPEEPVTRYAWAVEVELLAGELRAVERHLDAAERLAAEPQLFEPWLPAWIENQRGAIALRRGHAGEAEPHFARAQQMLPMREVIRFAERERDRLAR